MLRRKPTLALLCALLLGLALMAGCSPDGKDWESSPYNNGADTAAAQTESATESATEGETLPDRTETTTGSEVWTPFV